MHLALLENLEEHVPPMKQIESARSSRRARRELTLEESWTSLDVFNHTQKGRISLDLQGQCPCGLRVERIDPLHLLAGCRKRWLNQALSVLSLSIVFWVCYCCLLGPFLCSISLHLYVFCLLIVLVKLSILAKWLARKTPLRKPNHGKGIVSIKPRPKSVYDFFGLMYCFIVLWCVCLVPGPT